MASYLHVLILFNFESIYYLYRKSYINYSYIYVLIMYRK